MALPASREMTFAAGTTIPSATLNAIQDAIIGLETDKAEGSRVTALEAAGDALSMPPCFWDLVPKDETKINFNGEYFATSLDAGTRYVTFMFALRAGAKLSAVNTRVWVASGGSASVAAYINSVDHVSPFGEASTTLDSHTYTASAAHESTVLGLSNHILATNEMFHVQFSYTAGCYCVFPTLIVAI